VGVTGIQAAKSPGVPTFNRDVRPILSENCFLCHGPDANHRKGKLRLDLRDEAIAKGAIVPGKPAESELIKRILTTDEDDLMPPPESHKKLDAAQKETLRRWISAGAEYQKHWAFVPPVRPEVPPGRNGIDFLVERQLKQQGLKFSDEADRHTLSRRLHFDLVGLPPSPAEVDAFDKDRSRRRASRIAALRGKDGDRLARRGPVCRHHRISLRQSEEYLAVSGLRDPRIQCEQAV
jgi:hypothetical protein